MFPKDAFKFCPKCGGELISQEGNFLICQKCDFHVFINASTCAGAIIENENGEVLLTVRAHEPGKGELDLPGGFVEPYESAEEGLLRELKEELGVNAKIKAFIGTYSAEYLYQDIKIPLVNVMYVAEIEGEPKPNDDVAEIRYVPKEKLLEEHIWDPSLVFTIKDYLAKF